jgi:hypothetical protein
MRTLLIMLLLLTPAIARDLDFPRQLRAVNIRYTTAIQSGKTPVTGAELIACMERQGFHFLRHMHDCWRWHV